MELVIKIDEKDYQSLKDGHIPFNVLDIIMNGAIIPKGHGDLIDRQELLKSTLCKTFGLRSVDIENAPIIVEAESEVQYDKEDM